jgi:dihydropteroate synthase
MHGFGMPLVMIPNDSAAHPPGTARTYTRRTIEAFSQLGNRKYFRMSDSGDQRTALDCKLSQRFIALDPEGYFIIYLDRVAQLICAKHYTNVINEKGLALDPATGKPIPTKGKVERTPTAVFMGRTAKELCIKLFESEPPYLVSKLDHAAYLGREFMRAEYCLESGADYVQD